MTRPTEEEIREAGRRMQRGGPLGTGSSRMADRLVADAGEDGDDVAFQILDAATNVKPRRWAR